MPRYQLVVFALFLYCVVIPSNGFGQATQDVESIDVQVASVVAETMQAGNIPSLTIAMVDRENVIYTKAFGHANVLKQIPAETDTVYLIGSTFKTQSAAVLLSLVDEGKVGLDKPVSEYIGDLKIEGEDPEYPVLVRHLLTHTSGLPADFGPHLTWGFSAPKETDDYLADSLKVKRKPDEKYEYSNCAFQLISKIVATGSGQPYRQFVQKQLWDRLEMKDTAFQLRPDQYERLAIPYVFDEETSKQNPAVFLKADVWAAGMVYGTVQDQARWLMTILNRGKYKDQQIIAADSFGKMMTTQFECDHFNFAPLFGNDATIGLTWWLKEKSGEMIFAHSGSVPGYTAWITGNLDQGTGVAILTNGNRSHVHLSKLAEACLEAMSETTR